MVPYLPPGLPYVPPRTAIVENVGMVATSYCPDGYENAHTATGTVPKPGTVAVDPHVIREGTYLLVGGNFYVARDTGGDVKGDRIDIWSDDCNQSWNFGRRRVTVGVLGGFVVKPRHKERKIRHRADPDYARAVPRYLLELELLIAGAAATIGIAIGMRRLR